ncbi:MAG: hypothetical protein SWH68_15640 [Thermodesulfobacteriota bacterium]|nr:hypothetical protein [Thermodesulfobacteriota bacterium]
MNRHVDNSRSHEVLEASALPPAFLKVAAGEFKGLMADYLLLKGVAFLGGRHETTERDINTIHTLFQQSLALDPYFLQTCYYIQAYLVWHGKNYEEDIELLKISKNHRTWDWLPAFFIGFDYHYFLRDNLKAATYLMEASKKPGASPFLANLAARLSQRGGQTEAAIAFLKSMRLQTKDDKVKEQFDKRIRALEGVKLLEKGIAQYKAKFNHHPQSLDDLVTSGILSGLPENPYKKPFVLEDDGGIEF